MQVVKVHRNIGKLSQDISIGKHRLIADEPIDAGGEDRGPAPHDYLAAALASCTAITIRMYCLHKNWPLEDAEITVTLSKQGEITRLDRKIVLKGILEDEQKHRLIAVANSCPVHKTLHGKIEIETSLG